MGEILSGVGNVFIWLLLGDKESWREIGTLDLSKKYFPKFSTVPLSVVCSFGFPLLFLPNKK